MPPDVEHSSRPVTAGTGVNGLIVQIAYLLEILEKAIFQSIMEKAFL